MKTYEEIVQIFSTNLKDLMIDRGLSPYDLSKKIDISFKSIYRYVNGEGLPTGYSLYLLTNYFDCSMDDLFREGYDHEH